MNEMRRDPVTRKWVIIDRSLPVETVVESLRAAVLQDDSKRVDEVCSFCPGHEESTPPPVVEFANGQFRYREHGSDWQLRAIPNAAPVFQIEGNVNRRLVTGYDVMNAIGAHEVIVENRRHIDWDEMNLDEVRDILAIYHERMNDLSKDERFGHLFIFKNWGRGSYNRYSHPHSTLIASPAVPERIRRELDFTRRHYQMKERCLFCDIVTEESRRKNHHSGVVKTYENFVTISPFFAAHPFETWILPRRHNANFRTVQPEAFQELALAAVENLRMIKALVGPLSYTLLLFTRPNKVWGEDRDYWTTIDEDYHWHFKFLPRFPRVAGLHRSFSAGSGYLINQVPPEDVAELLRSNG